MDPLLRGRILLALNVAGILLIVGTLVAMTYAAG